MAYLFRLHILDRTQQHVGRLALGHVRVHIFELFLSQVHESRQHNDGHARMRLPNSRCYFRARHLRHFIVDDDRVNMLVSEDF